MKMFFSEEEVRIFKKFVELFVSRLELSMGANESRNLMIFRYLVPLRVA